MSAAPIFTGGDLDRASLLRSDPDRVSELLAQASTAVVAAAADGVLLDRSDDVVLRVVGGGEVTPYVDPAQPILLGIEAGVALFAADLEGLEGADRERLTDAGRIVSLREAGSRLARAEGGLAAYLVALLNWHRRHRFCANCGARTEMVEAGLSRRCPSCGASHFPRTDPVVIMVVEHDGRLLLGRRAGWPEPRYSVLAGFVSPGETPEEAVVREVREESGIEAHGARYVTSQPWPFPSSLMLGFEAIADGGEPIVSDGELEAVGWFTAADVRAAQRDRGKLGLPPPISIARTLIDGWLARQPDGV
jgi:NAD+ diphosphatase